MCGSFSLFACGPNGHFIEILLTNEPILLPVALHAEDSEFLLRSASTRRLKASLRLGNYQVFRMLQRGDGGLTGYGRELIQKFVQGMASLEIIEQVLERHSRPPEDRGSSEDLLVPYDDILVRGHPSLHLLRVYHRPPSSN